MSALTIRPNRVLFSSGAFDSDKKYIQVKANGEIPWPSLIVTIGSYQPGSTNITFLYKNGIGGVPAYYSGANPVVFRMGS